MKVTADDIKQMAQLVVILKKATFKELQMTESLTVALTAQWLGDFKKRMEQSFQQPTPLPPPVSSAEPSKVVKMDTRKKKK